MKRHPIEWLKGKYVLAMFNPERHRGMGGRYGGRVKRVDRKGMTIQRPAGERTRIGWDEMQHVSTGVEFRGKLRHLTEVLDELPAAPAPRKRRRSS